MKYNLERFDLADYDITRFDGPRAGEQAVDFALQDLDGRVVKLADYSGRWLVLEMGAATCPMYARNVKKMQKIAAAYPDVDFAVVYVREPHPGGKLGAHRSFDDKIEAAQRLPRMHREQRRILLDSLGGAMHTRYGLMPNSIYVINPKGKVVYRCDWAVASELEEVLENRHAIHANEHANRTVLDAPGPYTLLRTLAAAGWKAVWEFGTMLPQLGQAHKTADIYYDQVGHMAQGGPSMHDDPITTA